MNDLELRAALVDALRRPGPCDECDACEFSPHDIASDPWSERLARAIEDGDITFKVAAGAWL